MIIQCVLGPGWSWTLSRGQNSTKASSSSHTILLFTLLSQWKITTCEWEWKRWKLKIAYNLVLRAGVITRGMRKNELTLLHTLQLISFLFSDWFFSKYVACIENVHCTPHPASSLRKVLLLCDRAHDCNIDWSIFHWVTLIIFFMFSGNWKAISFIFFSQTWTNDFVFLALMLM